MKWEKGDLKGPWEKICNGPKKIVCIHPEIGHVWIDSENYSLQTC